MRCTAESFGGIRRIATVIIVGTLFCGDLVANLHAAPPAQATRRSPGSGADDKARSTVTNLGVGRHVDVRLNRGERIEGEIREIGADDFAVLVDSTGAMTTIAFGDVRQLGPIILKPASRSSRRRASHLVGAAVLVLYEIAMIRACAGKSC